MEENSECTDISINPFEAESTDSLHLSKFSPSIFKIKTPSSTKKSPKFRWSIDQLAILKPVDIDETPQQDIHLDQDNEQRIQQAIDEFFSQKQVAPSPWSAGKPLKHVTFSPHPPSTNYYDVKSADNSTASSCDSSFTKPSMVDACSQTSLTLPLDFDLHALLSSFYSYQESSLSEILSTSSLRRKLFLPAGSTTTDSDSSSPSMNYIQSSRCESGVFPETSLSLSPINSVKQNSVVPDRGTPNTPASAKSQFSSSPKSTPSSTPMGKKYGSLVCSDIESSPISPIKMDSLENPSDYHRVWKHPIEDTPCGKTKCMFYLAPPEMSPIPCFSGYSAKKAGSNCKGKENNFCGTPKLSNLKVPNYLPRGSVAKLNLMTVLDKHTNRTTNPRLQPAEHPVRDMGKEVLAPKQLLPNTLMHNNREDIMRSKQSGDDRDDLSHNDPCEMRLASCDTAVVDVNQRKLDPCEMRLASCDTAVVDVNQRKLSQMDASMLDYDTSPDTFDIDTNAAEEYLTSTMRRDFFSEAQGENKQGGFHFPINGSTGNATGCSLIAKISPDDMSYCQENFMDISQESLLQLENQTENLVSESNKMQSVPTSHDQLEPSLFDVTDGGMLQEGRCELEMSTMDSDCNIGVQTPVQD